MGSEMCIRDRQGMWHDPSIEPRFSQVVELDLSTVVPSISGPKRPQDRISLSDSKSAFEKILPTYLGDKTAMGEVAAGSTRVKNGDVVIASITSCTNTSNPSVMIGAALLAKKAVQKGLSQSLGLRQPLLQDQRL